MTIERATDSTNASGKPDFSRLLVAAADSLADAFAARSTDSELSVARAGGEAHERVVRARAVASNSRIEVNHADETVEFAFESERDDVPHAAAEGTASEARSPYSSKPEHAKYLRDPDQPANNTRSLLCQRKETHIWLLELGPVICTRNSEKKRAGSSFHV